MDLVFSSILGKSVLALGLHLTKEWLLASGSNNALQDARMSVGEAHWRLLAIAAVFLAIWHRPWELLNKRINVGVSFLLEHYRINIELLTTCRDRLIDCTVYAPSVV